MSKVALIIIYNHQYNENIEVIESIYKNRFSDIYHLVPFYTGNKKNVIAVYESSHYFQAYVTQGLKDYFKSKYVHYFFIADDLIINPSINEHNYTEHFQLKPKTCFIPEFIQFHNCDVHQHTNMVWDHILGAFSWNMETTAVKAKKQLPSYQNDIQKMNNFGLQTEQAVGTFQIMDRLSLPYINARKFLDAYNKLNRRGYFKVYEVFKFFSRKYVLNYPLVGSYSDIFIISADAMELFAHYCGVFAATELFVEIAVPTALVFSAQEINSEQNLALKPKTTFSISVKEFENELAKYDKSLDKLLADFPSKCLYLHPVKLSQWTYNEQ